MGTEYDIFQIGWYPLIIEITAKNLKPTDIIIGLYIIKNATEIYNGR